MNEKYPNYNTVDSELFKVQSLDLLESQLNVANYPGYPTRRLTFDSQRGVETLVGRLHLPIGEWDTRVFPNTPGDTASAILYDQGLTLDTYGRPLHPWINEMLVPNIGVVTGRGFYRHWGPNYTADPIILRTDTEEPMVLLIQRNDTGQWALPGGFVEANEHTSDAALREAYEETCINLQDYNPILKEVYSGPIADVRITAHAWPETTAYAVLLDPNLSRALGTEPFGGNQEEVQMAAWFKVPDINEALFGSHRLLVNLAIKHV